MSKTVRKNILKVENPKHWNTYQQFKGAGSWRYMEYTFRYWARKGVHTAEDYIKYWTRRLTSDKETGMRNCPKWFRQSINRRWRRSSNQQLRIHQDGDYIEKYKKGANWEWF